MEKDKSNKAVLPGSNKKMVKVRVKAGRAVEGIGGPGTVAEIAEDQAKRLADIGYVEIVKET